MPTLTRWYIKTALVYLVLSLIAGVLVAVGAATRLPYPLASLTPLYFQILMVGWITQLIFGIAYWMFPIFSREMPRRSPLLGWAAYGLINAGLLLQIIAELADLFGEFALSGWISGLAAFVQFLAALAFVTNTWNRIRGR